MEMLREDDEIVKLTIAVKGMLGRGHQLFIRLKLREALAS